FRGKFLIISDWLLFSDLYYALGCRLLTEQSVDGETI
ncbi:MAG: hypothetical protein ACJAS5_000931, partial [Lentimonas sp.]